MFTFKKPSILVWNIIENAVLAKKPDWLINLEPQQGESFQI